MQAELFFQGHIVLYESWRRYVEACRSKKNPFEEMCTGSSMSMGRLCPISCIGVDMRRPSEIASSLGAGRKAARFLC